jgi:hypothetical protein
MKVYCESEEFNRRKGRTYETCKTAKDKDWIVIEHSVPMAALAKKDYGVQAYSVAQNLQGINGQMLVDPSTLACIFSDVLKILYEKEGEIYKLNSKIGRIRDILNE